MAFVFFTMPPKLTQALEEVIFNLSERVAELHTSIDRLSGQQSSMEQRNDTLLTAFTELQQCVSTIPPSPAVPPLFPLASTPLPSPSLSFSHQLPSLASVKPPKLHLPLFDGGNPLDLVGSNGCVQNGQLSSWDAFVRSLELRFGPSSYDNHEAALFKLHQRGSAADLQVEFERLCNRVIGLPPESILNCFISALRPDIQRELAILRPSSISQAIGLAKLVEAKLADTRRVYPPFRPSVAPASRLSCLLATPTLFPIRRFSPLELHDRRARAYASIVMTSSPRAISSPSFSTLRRRRIRLSLPTYLCLRGFIREHSISILVDSDSSHNILQPRVAQFLGLTITPIVSFSVMVGNGDSIQCSGFCPAVPLSINSHKFLVPFYILPIHGADAVLGAQWLSTLGPFLSDYSVPSMQVFHDGELITLSGNPSSTPTYATFSQFQRLLTTDAVHSLFAISVHTTVPSSSISPDSDVANLPPNVLPPDLYNLIAEFRVVFDIPRGLPPHRHLDHHIHLLPNHPPVNVKPHRYPHSQKIVMTNLIVEMLRDGVIQPSTSPFSSPVLLVVSANRLYAKLSKCHFGVSSVDYLGHMIAADGVRANPSKLRAIADWPTPHSITALRGFLGLTGFYRRFVRHYASIAAPLTDLLKQKSFHWTSVANAAFRQLQAAMLALPVLHLLDFSQSFEVTTDAS
ncbi:UNVERIFIED_CONTAM: putative mitochondrial protein [Sesamum radiatum]|uniref:Mitochondrial protein n=1 Tax=Sesamum radiatum TaxID=300843 RepID=A0AAW2U9T6_SESRA